MGEDSSGKGALLRGGRLQRVEISGDLALLQVHAGGASWLLLLSSAGQARAGLLPRSGESIARARALLDERAVKTKSSARVLGFDGTGLWIERAGGVVRIGAPSHRGPITQETRDPAGSAMLPARERDACVARGEALLEALEGSSVDRARRGLLVRIDRADERLARRARAVLGDLSRGADAEAEAERARLFVAAAARAPRGTTSLTVTDWSTGEPLPAKLRLAPDKLPKDQVEAIFARARRLKRGAVMAKDRLEESAMKRARLARLRDAALATTSLDGLSLATAAMHREDPALLPRDRPKTGARKASSGERLPYRTFVSSAGARMLVGRGASDNDELTLHVARPHDLWLHARGGPGAHVVVPLEKGHEAPADLLVDAAHLAAHFSEWRGETQVEVTYVARRHVRKPRGSPPGLVTVDRDKTLVLRVDPARLAALLAREEAAP